MFLRYDIVTRGQAERYPGTSQTMSIFCLETQQILNMKCSSLEFPYLYSAARYSVIRRKYAEENQCDCYSPLRRIQLRQWRNR